MKPENRKRTLMKHTENSGLAFIRRASRIALRVLSAAVLAVLALTSHRPQPGTGISYAVQEAKPAAEEETADKEHGKGEGLIPFTSEQCAQFGVEVAEAGPGDLESFVDFPGEVRLDADREAEVTPPVSGRVEEVGKSLGDTVHAGEIMAVLESRELATASAAYFAAREKVGLATRAFEREKGLWTERISAEQDYLEAKQALAEARIALTEAGEQLKALGVAPAALKPSPEHSSGTYDLRAPIDGVVITKDIVLGEFVNANATVFAVADLSHVWVDFEAPPAQLPGLKPGVNVRIAADGAQDTQAPISYIGPALGKETRTALVRVVLANEDGAWRAGQFVTGRVATGSEHAEVMIPKLAVQTLDGLPSVFVSVEGGFEVKPVQVGRSNATSLEILSGLEAGQSYVKAGAFLLKAELGKTQASHEEE